MQDDVLYVCNILHDKGFVQAQCFAHSFDFLYGSRGTHQRSCRITRREIHQRKYNEATAGYLQTVVDAKQAQDDILEQYAVYDLATTYLMQNENDAALERYSQIKDDSPKAVRYSTFYNMGIIAHRSGEYKKAVECFIEALKIDNTKTSAKINLELSRVKAEKRSKGKGKQFKFCFCK